MNDRFERAFFFRVFQDPGSEGRTIQTAVCRHHLRAEPCDDALKDRGARLLEPPDDLVSVDDGGTPVSEEPGDGGFAGGDIAGQGDMKRDRVSGFGCRVSGGFSSHR